MRILVPIPMRISPPMISARDPIFCPNFLPNSIPMNERIKVVIPMNIAGTKISSVLAVSHTPMARASILVAIPRVIKDRRVNISFFSSVSSGFHHS